MENPRRLAELELSLRESLPDFDARFLNVAVLGITHSLREVCPQLIPPGQSTRWLADKITGTLVGGDRKNAEVALVADALKTIAFSFPVNGGPASAIILHIKGVPLPTVMLIPSPPDTRPFAGKAFVYAGTGSILLYPHEGRCFCQDTRVANCTYCDGRGNAKSFFGNRGLAEKMEAFHDAIEGPPVSN